jgi:two-component sensor histidine kinase
LNFISSSAISELSENAKAMLYEEQNRYSAMLLQHSQMSLGGQAGAKRFADCLQLVNGAFYNAYNMDLLKTYMDAFHQDHGFASAPEYIPKCLQTLL